MYKNRAKLIGMVIGDIREEHVSELVNMVKLMGEYLGMSEQTFQE